MEENKMVKLENPAVEAFHKNVYEKKTFLVLDQFGGVGADKDEMILVKPKDIDKVSASVAFKSENPHEETVHVDLPFNVEAYVFKHYADVNELCTYQIFFIQNGVVYQLMDHRFYMEIPATEYMKDTADAWTRKLEEVRQKYQAVNW